MLGGALPASADPAQTEPSAPGSLKKRPNIILFMPDELRADSLGCYGNPLTKTPYFDKLASEGARFANCPVALKEPFSYKLNCLACFSKYSEARQDNARIVGVGFLSGLVVKHAPSVTNRFLTSCAWQKPFRTEVLASDPMRTVPTSCATPPGCR